jgi:iron complex transport system substrate-binding protein
MERLDVVSRMQPLKALIPILVILVLAVPVTSITYSVGNGNSQSSNEIIVTDALGRTVTLPGEPHRIISLAPSITEMLFYFNLQDKLVGVDSISYNDSYMNISGYVRTHNVTDVGGYWWSTIKTEKILALKPDLVLADKGAHRGLLQFFQDYNITVVYLNGGGSRSLQDIYEDVGILDTIFNLGNRTTKFINSVENSIAKYHMLLKPYWGIRVLVVVGIYNGIWVAGKSTYIDDIISRLGLVNSAEVIGWMAVSIEEIASWSPDIILVTSSGISEQMLRDAGLYDLGVKMVLLNATETNILSRPGPLIILAPQAIYHEIAANIPCTTTPTTTTTQSTASSPTSTTGTTGTTSKQTTAASSARKTWWQGDILVLTVASILSLAFGIGLGYLLFKKIS